MIHQLVGLNHNACARDQLFSWPLAKSLGFMTTMLDRMALIRSGIDHNTSNSHFRTPRIFRIFFIDISIFLLILKMYFHWNLCICLIKWIFTDFSAPIIQLNRLEKNQYIHKKSVKLKNPGSPVIYLDLLDIWIRLPTARGRASYSSGKCLKCRGTPTVIGTKFAYPHGPYPQKFCSPRRFSLRGTEMSQKRTLATLAYSLPQMKVQSDLVNPPPLVPRPFWPD